MKNIRNFKEEKMKSARQERIHSKYAGTKWDDTIFVPAKRAYSWTKRFILKRIGTSYDSAYSDFLKSIKDGKKDIPGVLDNTLVKNIFKYYFEPPYNMFYVDGNGSIRESEYRNRKSDDKYIYEYPEGHKYRYVLRDEYKDNPSLKESVEKYFGADFYDRMLAELTYEEYIHIVSSIENNHHVRNSFTGSLDWIRSVSVMFKEIDYAPFRKVEYTVHMRKRRNAEIDDCKRKRRREMRKDEEERLSGLLQSIEDDRKEEHKLENYLKIIKHGFDEKESFRGEPYHGKKKTKK